MRQGLVRRGERFLMWQLSLFGLIILVLIVMCIFYLPQQLVPDNATLEHQDRPKLENDIRATLLQGTAGLLLGIGAIATWRQLQLTRKQLEETISRNRDELNIKQRELDETLASNHRQLELTLEAQITDRFQRAIQLLGNENRDVVIGGIYALERLAKDSSIDRGVIKEVLASFVRAHAPWPPRADDDYSAEYPLLELPPLRMRLGDVQTAVTVLGRYMTSYDKSGDDGPNESLLDSEPLMLSRIDLRRAYLRRAMFNGVDFNRTHLGRADLIGAHFEGGRFGGVNLESALLTDSQLSRAYLVGTNLENAHLVLRSLDAV